MLRKILMVILLWLGMTTVLNATSPAKMMEVCYRDLQTIREVDRPYTRYFVLWGMDKEELIQWEQALFFWVNSLSAEPIEQPRLVMPGVWRVDLRNYRWRRETWEKLAFDDPYFHIQLVLLKDVKTITKIIDHPGGDLVHPVTGAILKNLPARKYSYEVPTGSKDGKKPAFAPWLDTKLALLFAEISQSQIPVVRADWWLSQVVVGNDRGTGYYDWLNLGNKEQDFLDLGGVDIKKAIALRKEIGALVSRSTVTLHNRALDRYQGITGAYWKSRDFARNTDVKNSLRLLNEDIKEDASEQYITLPNGLFAFWLQNADGVRQDTAPDNIASDGKSTSPDRRVKAGISCVRCHEEGIRPINDWARKVYQPPFQLEDRDYAEGIRKRNKYLSDLVEVVDEDQARYAKALKKTNGLTPVENAKVVALAWQNYVDTDLSATQIAIELGVEKEVMIDAFRKEARISQLDPILAAIVQGQPVLRDHFLEVIPLIYDILSRQGK